MRAVALGDAAPVKAVMVISLVHRHGGAALQHHLTDEEQVLGITDIRAEANLPDRPSRKEVARRVAGEGQLIAVGLPGEHRRNQRVADGGSVKARAGVKPQRHVLRAVFSLLDHPAERRVGLRRLRRLIQPREHAGLHPVVRVAKAHELARRSVKPRVARRRYTPVLRKGDHLHARILRLRRAKQRKRIVRARVVHEDQLDVLHRLRPQGGDASGQVCRGIVDRNDHGNPHSPMPSAPLRLRSARQSGACTSRYVQPMTLNGA